VESINFKLVMLRDGYTFTEYHNNEYAALRRQEYYQDKGFNVVIYKELYTRQNQFSYFNIK
jgi:hypothetical protein